MQSSTKAALKRRVKKWGDAQRLGFASPTDMLHAKVQYLEEVLALYQQEVEFLANAMHDSGRGEDIVSNSEDLPIEGGRTRQPFRSSQPHQHSNSASLAEVENLKMQLLAAETELLEMREGFQSELSSESQRQSKRLSDLQAALEEKEAELETETERRLVLEREASQATRRLQQNNDFLSSLDQTSMKVRENLERQLQHHQQLVASLLQTSGVEKEEQQAQGDGGDDGLESMRGGGDGNASTRSGGTSGTDGKQRQRHPGGAAGGTAAANDPEKSASASHLPSNLVGRTPIERLSNILAKVEAVISSQQVELAVATRCAIESFAQKEKELRNKAQQSYQYCEAQMARMKELEEQFLEQRDYANQERDRALNTRDRLVSQLRSLEAQRSSKTTTKSAEVQTIVKGDFSNSTLDRADSFFYPSGASVASHGTSAAGGGVAPSTTSRLEKKSSK